MQLWISDKALPYGVMQCCSSRCIDLLLFSPPSKSFSVVVKLAPSALDSLPLLLNPVALSFSVYGVQICWQVLKDLGKQPVHVMCSRLDIKPHSNPKLVHIVFFKITSSTTRKNIDDRRHLCLTPNWTLILAPDVQVYV